jgi:hypothetical protein
MSPPTPPAATAVTAAEIVWKALFQFVPGPPEPNLETYVWAPAVVATRRDVRQNSKKVRTFVPIDALPRIQVRQAAVSNRVSDSSAKYPLNQKRKCGL